MFKKTFSKCKIITPTLSRRAIIADKAELAKQIKNSLNKIKQIIDYRKK